MKFRFLPSELLSAITATDGNVSRLAKNIGVAPSTIYRAAEGRPLRLDTYVKLCAALNINPAFKGKAADEN